MSPTPEIFRPPAGAAPSPAPQVTELLGGLLHLAYAERPTHGIVTVATGFTPESAQTRAELRASALHSLYTLTTHPPTTPPPPRPP
ncbi:hypothetical protein ABGB17_37315, partial [Sphaerisporangium sp. B11E5]|uniref:hypothetical protein n=1 Tax=Sphaerisporangium sp. B11E5 TaxID=3153563 RepID=UPI00325EC2F7